MNELPEQYEIEIAEDSPGKPVLLNGDDFLLYRMLRNLVGNSITHNPNGCKITLYVGSDMELCLFEISDTGCGIATSKLSLLNNGMPITSTQEENNVTEHGLGHKIVRQIVDAHHRKLYFLKNSPHGLTVKISLPLK